MYRLICWFFISAIALAVPLNAADGPEPNVSQLRINKKIDDDLDLMLSNFNGVHFGLILNRKEADIIGVDPKASRIISATDDTGVDLIGDKANKAFDGLLCKHSKKRDRIAIPISLPKIPEKGATSVSFKAEFSLLCGRDEKSDETRLIDISVGGKVAVGQHSIELKPRSKSLMKYNDTTRDQVAISADQDGRWIKSIDFIDAGDKNIESSPCGSIKMNDEWETNFWLPKGTKSTKIRVVYFQKIQSEIVPVDLKLAIGLP